MINISIANTSRYPTAYLRDMICRRLVGCKAFSDGDIRIAAAEDSSEDRNNITITLGSRACQVKADLDLCVNITSVNSHIPSREEFANIMASGMASIVAASTAPEGATLGQDDIDVVMARLQQDVDWYIDELVDATRRGGEPVSIPGIPGSAKGKNKAGGPKSGKISW